MDNKTRYGSGVRFQELQRQNPLNFSITEEIVTDFFQIAVTEKQVFESFSITVSGSKVFKLFCNNFGSKGRVTQKHLLVIDFGGITRRKR